MVTKKIRKTSTLLVLSATMLMAMPSIGIAQPKNKATSGMNLLEQTSQAFTQIAKKAMPATVFIKAQINPQLGGFEENPFNLFNDDLFRRFFNFPNGQQHGQQPFLQQIPQQPQISYGSGFFVSPDGYILTNNHVIKDAQQITVVINDGREFSATIAGTDPRTDVAVLKINETSLPYLNFGDSDDLEIGEWVVAIGTPFALESSLTVGVVSAKGRQDLGITSLEDFIQTDAAINPGNSGGPLLNLQGDVIGVNTAIVSKNGGGYMGIGFSIPSRMAQHVMEQIIQGGTVKRAYLGVIMQPMDKELSEALGLEKQEGILISEVVKDSPAAKGGLQQGDILLSYNNKPIKSISKFRNDIAMMTPQDKIDLKLLRNNKPVDLTVSLGIMSEMEALSTELIQKLGIEVETLTNEMAAKLNIPTESEGVVISRIKPGSPAQMAGLKPSFLITHVAVNNLNEPRRVRNAAEFETALKELGARKHLFLIVRHQNFQRYYTIKIN